MPPREIPSATVSWAKTIVLCVNLYAAPTTLSEGYALAKEIDGISPDQDFGTNNNFSFVRVGIPIPGFPWYGLETPVTSLRLYRQR